MNEEKETGRIEAFSDGVFAIAVTLLVLDIHVPDLKKLPPHTILLRALIQQWPMYFAYGTSFLTILIMWMNHHKLFQVIRRTDYPFLMINGLLLMGITVVPFPTSLLAAYIQGPEARTAAAIYSGTFIAIALLYNWLWHYAIRGNRLLSKHSNPAYIEAITRQYAYGPLYYVVTFALAFVSVPTSVAACLLLAIYFALPAKADSAVINN